MFEDSRRLILWPGILRSTNLEVQKPSYGNYEFISCLDYTEAKQESEGNRITFTMVFLSVSLLLLLLAIWLGIAFANSLTYPVSLLINGSEKISRGNF